jgi:thiamine pyrophosphokinase
MSEQTIILANGKFPVHKIPLDFLKNAGKVICCDGAAFNLDKYGIESYAIVGDLDSLSEELSKKYADRLYPDYDQDTNDLTKSVKWCIERGYKDLVILGATGEREDHTLGNISLLVDYSAGANVIMVTDSGIFIPLFGSSKLTSFPRQQISIFSINTETEITSTGLKYPLNHLKLKNWWMATLNESEGHGFTLEFKGGPLIIYYKFPDR